MFQTSWSSFETDLHRRVVKRRQPDLQRRTKADERDRWTWLKVNVEHFLIQRTTNLSGAVRGTFRTDL